MPNTPIPMVSEYYGRNVPGQGVFPLFKDYFPPEQPATQPTTPPVATPPPNGETPPNGGNGGGDDENGNNGVPGGRDANGRSRSNWRDLALAIINNQPIDFRSLPPPHQEFAQLLLNDPDTMAWLGQLATADLAFEQGMQLPLPGLPQNQQSWLSNIARDVDRRGAPNNPPPAPTGPSTADMVIDEEVIGVGTETGTPYFRAGESGRERVQIQPVNPQAKGRAKSKNPALPVPFQAGTTGGIYAGVEDPMDSPDFAVRQAHVTALRQANAGYGPDPTPSMFSAPSYTSPTTGQPVAVSRPQPIMQPMQQSPIQQQLTSVLNSMPNAAPKEMYDLVRVGRAADAAVSSGQASVQEAADLINRLVGSIAPQQAPQQITSSFVPPSTLPRPMQPPVSQMTGRTGPNTFDSQERAPGTVPSNQTIPTAPASTNVSLPALNRQNVEPNRGTTATEIPPKPVITPPRVGEAGLADTGEIQYDIEPGDTLSAIAARYGTTVQAIAQLNGISDPNMIQAGARIRIPKGGAQTPPPTTQPVAPPIAPSGQGVVIPDVLHGGTAQITPDISQAVQAAFGDQANIALHIVAAESKGDPYAVGGAGERGIFQIHPIHFSSGRGPLGYTWDDMWNPIANTAVAKWLFQNQGGWRPWTTAPGVLKYLGMA